MRDPPVGRRVLGLGGGGGGGGVGRKMDEAGVDCPVGQLPHHQPATYKTQEGLCYAIYT